MKLYFEDINSYIGKTTKYLIKEISRPEPETISRYGLSSDTESFRYHGIDRGWGILITNWNEEPSKENILKYGFDSEADARRGGRMDSSPYVNSERHSAGYYYTYKIVPFEV